MVSIIIIILINFREAITNLKNDLKMIAIYEVEQQMKEEKEKEKIK